MEETEKSKTNKNYTSKTRYCRGGSTNHHHHHHHHHQSHHHNGFFYQTYPPLLPLPTPPLLQLQLPATPLFPQNYYRPKPHVQKPSWKQMNHLSPPPPPPPPPASSSDIQSPPFSTQASEAFQKKLSLHTRENDDEVMPMSMAVVAKRPDSGGRDGAVIPLLANHFLVKFDASERIFHYDVDISPQPSKEVARMIKRQLVQENQQLLSGALPAFDGRRNLYSPMEFQEDKLEFFVNLPIPTSKSLWHSEAKDEAVEKLQKSKLFRVNIKLVSRLDGHGLVSYLSKDEENSVPLPQDYLHALDVVLREYPAEKCIPVGRSLYSSSMGGGTTDIGGGAVGLRGFFQSLRPTQQGLALNVDFSVTAFHESIGVIPYLQKRLHFLHDLSQRKTATLVGEEKNEVEKALKNIRVFVCHRETDQIYRVFGLTDETTEDLWFRERDGTNLRLVDYFKDHYNHDIQFRNLPCLQISRSKPCYLPMELCMVCEGQRFLGKLSDDQTIKILKMGCQRPKERKAIIDGVMGAGSVGPTSGGNGKEFNLQISRAMTQLSGRVLQPPKLKLGDGGQVTDLIPSRQDRQWNLLESHVFEGTRIHRWALISFGGTPDQRSCIPRFINQLSQRCEELGIYLNRNPILSSQFEAIQVLNNVSLLESKLQKIYRAAGSNKLQLLICVMERKHRGYADFKRISETSIGVVTQCCLYGNLANKLSSQFLANLALKINAKVGGSTVALFNSLPSQLPRLFGPDDPAMFFGADVTHPHPLDDCSPSVAAVVGSMNWPAANKYISRIRSQTHRQEIIQDLKEMVGELLEDFYQAVHILPKRIIFFRDGVSETQFKRVLQEELQAIRAGCLRFPEYRPTITFAVVQKRHHTRLFPNETDRFSPGARFSDENIPPGTVVDSVVTHPNEFDFYLCSHWGTKGTSRPTHYHVLWDENQFSSDELQKLVYSQCYTFAKCTKPVSLIPAAYYAHLAAYRGRLYLDRPSSTGLTGTASSVSRASPLLKTTPLPKLSENVKKTMFYC
ncbi:hypothetical protein MKW94_026323 [Papaver nudicaule]|uniref:Argonaute 7 n=1 Tax=Papaver nudicaule TaxID=74823 RepID=A0AA41VND8_PAPNU|nr:hypothetical protein [Papaver nudicaule]